VLRKPWQPLQPTSVSLSGTTLTVTFHVPVPPLAWEKTLSAPHQTVHTEWAKGHGFEVADSTGPLVISDAVLSGEAVQLTLAKAPGAGLVVRYAMLQDGAGYLGGKPDGRRGQLRDVRSTRHLVRGCPHGLREYCFARRAGEHRLPH